MNIIQLFTKGHDNPDTGRGLSEYLQIGRGKIATLIKRILIKQATRRIGRFEKNKSHVLQKKRQKVKDIYAFFLMPKK